MTAFVAFVIGGLVVFSSGSAEESRRGGKRITLPAEGRLGFYVALKEGEPKRLTMREEEALAARGGSDVTNRRKALEGVIEYSSENGLALVIQSDKHNSINAKLGALSVIPKKDVRALVCIGQVDIEALKVIASFHQLRDLTIEASETLESSQGASQLSGLKELKYLEIVPANDRKFGSQSFCAACMSLETLSYLAIPCEKLTDSHVKVLAGHAALERLYLRSTKPVLGRASLQALNRMRKLRELGIVCTEDITDLDVMGFTEVSLLEVLSIATKAPLTCQERFESRRPDCKLFVVDLLDEFSEG